MKSLFITLFSLSLLTSAYADAGNCKFKTEDELMNLFRNNFVTITIHNEIIVDGLAQSKSSDDYTVKMKNKSENPRRVKGTYKVAEMANLRYGLKFVTPAKSEISDFTFYEDSHQLKVNFVKETKLFTLKCVAKPVLDVTVILDKALEDACIHDA